MQRIREWMQANPDQAKEVRRQNKSYVFFRITDLANEDEAVGGAGRAADARPLDRGRPLAACLRHAVLHRGRSADRQFEDAGEISPSCHRAGYRLGHRRAGARRHLFRRRRRGGARWRAASAIPATSSCCLPRALDPVEAGARSAAAAAAAERPSARSTSTMADLTPGRQECRCRNRRQMAPEPPRSAPPKAAQNRNRGTRSDEPAPPIERGRARLVGEVHARRSRRCGRRQPDARLPQRCRPPERASCAAHERIAVPAAAEPPPASAAACARSAGGSGSASRVAANRSTRASICMA